MGPPTLHINSVQHSSTAIHVTKIDSFDSGHLCVSDRQKGHIFKHEIDETKFNDYISKGYKNGASDDWKKAFELGLEEAQETLNKYCK